jgi:glycosyltransferase involved in cell wall biosynthesis
MQTKPIAPNSKAPVISVVIPLYNKAPYIRRTIQTVLEQSFQDIEIVIVDDGSTDGGGVIVQEMDNARCRLYCQPNAGKSAARNKGVELARSDLIAFLDADDEWHPEFLAASLALHQRWPDIVGSLINYERSDIHQAALPRNVAAGPLESYFRFCLANGGSGMWTGAVMVRKKPLLEAGGFPLGSKMGEDLDTWFRLACQGPIAYEPRPLAEYFCDRGICSTSKVDCDIWPTFQSWKRAGRIPKKELRAAEQFAAVLRLITVAMRCREGDVASARRMMSELPLGRAWSARRVACWLAAWVPVFPPRYWLGLADRMGVPIYWKASQERAWTVNRMAAAQPVTGGKP